MESASLKIHAYTSKRKREKAEWDARIATLKCPPLIPHIHLGIWPSLLPVKWGVQTPFTEAESEGQRRKETGPGRGAEAGLRPLLCLTPKSSFLGTWVLSVKCTALFVWKGLLFSITVLGSHTEVWDGWVKSYLMWGNIYLWCRCFLSHRKEREHSQLFRKAW